MKWPPSQTHDRQKLIFPKRWIGLLLGIYGLMGLINLDRLPIAWTDEVQNLDPALVWHATGEYASRLWPNPGAETHFLSYPPLIEGWHTLWLYVGKSIWMVRLPFLLFQLISGCLFYCIVLAILNPNKIPKNPAMNSSLESVIHGLALLFTAIFLLDKSTAEISRSMRVEVLVMLLLLGLIYGIQKLPPPLQLGEASIQKNKPYTFAKQMVFLGLVLGSLAMAHLYTWPIVFVSSLWLIKECIQQENRQTGLSIVSFITGLLAPFLLFIVSVKPEWHNLFAQISFQARDHQANSFLENIVGFFYTRFVPYTLEQPYTIILHCMAWIASFYLLFKQYKSLAPFWRNLLNKNKDSHPHTREVYTLIPILFLSFSIPAAMLLAPQHRYYPIQNMLGLLVFVVLFYTHKPRVRREIFIAIHTRPGVSNGNLFPEWSSPFLRKLVVGTGVILLLFPYVIRHTVAILQSPERNPSTAIEFLNNNLNQMGGGEILGEPIAEYWLAQTPQAKHWTYGFEFYPQHFPFNPNIPRYFLSRVGPKQVPFLQTIDSLMIKPRWAFTAAFGHTYNGLYLYKIPSENAWRALTKPAMLKSTSGH
ncbi:MAG: hypothetical protein CK532_00605 [Flavobacteriales bacterium]|nr:MAG: hypothetical protein CK532_00605 [Flavobacteriales bacterium]